MNKVLELKGTFQQERRSPGPAVPNLPTAQSVHASKLEKLSKDLEELKKYWSGQTCIPGAFVSVYYKKIAAKTNRIQALLSRGTRQSANSTIVGAKFTDDPSPKHIITHYIDLRLIDETIESLNLCVDILRKDFGGEINHETITEINKKLRAFAPTTIAKTTFLKIVVDAYYVAKFDVQLDDSKFQDDSIVTIYQTGIKTTQLLRNLGVHLTNNRVMDETTVLLMPDELALLRQKAPYLISMAVSDISELTKDDFEMNDDSVVAIPSPKSEPIIGVIDTMFDESVYFGEWVEFTKMVSDDIPLSPDDYIHGTAVSSIIVDGPGANPDLEDGCGRFRVRHFGVAAGGKFSSFDVLKKIEEIIIANNDIKVWNLSLGSKLEIHPHFISPEAAILDKIQNENDILFVVAGTNKGFNDQSIEFIGSPADSINALVVNAVNRNNTPTSYARKGPVLSFFTKPDISYYGGDSENPIRVCTPTGEGLVRGTSFAAPWIARKMSYLIDMLGLSREVAKAMIVNAATGWEKQVVNPSLIGHGVVPIHVQDVIECSDDEIQFVISGVSEEYNTYNYNIPIPDDKDFHPFVAKATVCYFPHCERNQGVDYTSTELEFKFGRLDEKGIKSINNNFQNSDFDIKTYEEDARTRFRKWDNVKHIREVSTGRNKAKKKYGTGLWGLSLKTNERHEEKYGSGLKFGIVVTLKEINGVNRIDEFIKNCLLRGWLVNEINVQNRIDIYNIAEEEIEFSVE